MTVQISYTDVLAAWRAYTEALRRGGPDSAITRHAKDRYNRLAQMHDEIGDALHDLEHEQHP